MDNIFDWDASIDSFSIIRSINLLRTILTDGSFCFIHRFMSREAAIIISTFNPLVKEEFELFGHAQALANNPQHNVECYFAFPTKAVTSSHMEYYLTAKQRTKLMDLSLDHRMPITGIIDYVGSVKDIEKLIQKTFDKGVSRIRLVTSSQFSGIVEPVKTEYNGKIVDKSIMAVRSDVTYIQLSLWKMVFEGDYISFRQYMRSMLNNEKVILNWYNTMRHKIGKSLWSGKTGQHLEKIDSISELYATPITVIDGEHV